MNFDQVTVAEILKAVRSFPNGSAGGIDGLRPQHLKDLTCAAAGEVTARLLERLTAVVNLMLGGNVPLEVCEILYGACLTALRKKDGGTRPIAVGNTIRRLACKVVGTRVVERMAALFRPAQLGYGTRGGAEAAVHAARACVSAAGETRVMLKLDFRNAFNTLRRDKVLQSVKTHLPDYFPFIFQMYRHSSHLFFGDFLIASACGVQQGDPLGPLLFCLVTRELTSSLKSPLNAWFLDDGTLIGSVDSVLQDLTIVRESGIDLGLELNPEKCEASVTGGDSATRAEILLQV